MTNELYYYRDLHNSVTFHVVFKSFVVELKTGNLLSFKLPGIAHIEVQINHPANISLIEMAALNITAAPSHDAQRKSNERK